MTETDREGTSSEGLVRAIGRWSLVALTVNCIIGSGAFGLPAVLAGLLGRASVLAVVLAAAAMGVIIRVRSHNDDFLLATCSRRFSVRTGLRDPRAHRRHEEAGPPQHISARDLFHAFVSIQTLLTCYINSNFEISSAVEQFFHFVVQPRCNGGLGLSG